MIFRYPGGKSRNAEWIIDHAPPYDEYREPFVGGGGVFFKIPTSKRRWINDQHTGLVATYRELANGKILDYYPLVTSMIVDGDFGGSPRDLFDDMIVGCGSEGIRYLILNRFSFNGRVRYDLLNRTCFTNPGGWGKRFGEKIQKASDIMQGVRVTLGDYAALLSEPGENVWLYVDPPYVKNTELSETSRLYQHNFENEDHERLAQLLKDCPHKWALSYDDCPFIRDLYKGFRFAEKQWVYAGNVARPDGEELLVMNY